ncbi:MAG: diguanylate cyclase domain-containing protein [Hyalangium sp.]|uniref:diguanylate cyclase domain-containing protein n=1 Tax=Hyalangium sp. TaxID=2028555 RepID=UPI00389A02BB
MNDRFGHDAGDAALSAAGSRIAEIGARFSAIPFRKSGDEFVLLTTNARDAKQCADALAEAFGPGFLITFEASQLTVRGAVGFSVRQDNEATLKRLVDQADAACRRAKLSGGIKPVEWSPETSLDDSVSIRKRCSHCQARCANCGATFPEAVSEDQRSVA